MNRQAATDYIKSEFGVNGENLLLNFPDFTVFRNQKNKKWFAIIMSIEKSKLGLKGTGKVDIINLKCGNILMGSLLQTPGYLPAYHMSKAHWITVLLDGSVAEGEIKDLIHLSYEMVEKKRVGRRSENFGLSKNK